jgi:hypothetical protein
MECSMAEEIPVRAILNRMDGVDGGPPGFGDAHAFSSEPQFYGSETVPNPVPRQRWTLCFLAALVLLTYAGFAFTLLFGGGL